MSVSFIQALGYEHALRMQRRVRIRESLARLNPSEEPPMVIEEHLKRNPVTESLKNESQQTTRGRAGRAMSSRSQIAQPEQQKRDVVREGAQRSREVSNGARRARAASEAGHSKSTKRNRKAIANTQADKHGRDSASMTSLATSGIDGKGLKINQVR